MLLMLLCLAFGGEMVAEGETSATVSITLTATLVADEPDLLDIATIDRDSNSKNAEQDINFESLDIYNQMQIEEL